MGGNHGPDPDLGALGIFDGSGVFALLCLDTLHSFDLKSLYLIMNLISVTVLSYEALVSAVH